MLRVLRQAERLPEGTRLGLRLWLCVVVIFALLALFAPVGSSGDEGGGASAAVDLEQIEKAFQQVIAGVSPSVVGIRVQRRYLTTLPGGDEATASGAFEQLVTVNGSGTIIDRDGLILTNQHVIQSTDQIEVFFHDGHSTLATVVGADPRSDLAVLKVEREGLKPAPLVDWSSVARGQWAIALGNPYGLGDDGKLSVSVGVISNLGRRLPGLGEVDDRFYTDMIQTTAAINPGCSGGPLFNIRGELIGVVTAMHTRAPADEGVGFAIPMNSVKRRLIEKLRGGTPVDYGYLGLMVRVLRPEEQEAAGLEPQVGAVVQRVDPEGPADAVGVREGDLILRFDRELVRGPGSLAELVGQTPPGTSVAVELRRGEQRLVVHPTLRRRETSRVSWMRGEALLWRGMRLANLTPHSRERMGVEVDAVGVIVIDVVAGSPAERAAVQIGDVIEDVGEGAIGSISAFRERVRGEHGAVKIRVRTRGELVIPP